MKHLERQIHQLCDALRSNEWEIPIGLVAQADAIQEALRRSHAKRPSPSSKLKGPRHATEKAAKDAQHALDWAAIKTAVMERARVESDGRCELGCGREINDPHHLIGGSGKRIPNERFDTVIGICRQDHDAYEDGDLEVLGKVRRWAWNHDYYQAMNETERRIRHVRIVRAAAAAKGEGRT